MREHERESSCRDQADRKARGAVLRLVRAVTKAKVNAPSHSVAHTDLQAVQSKPYLQHSVKAARTAFSSRSLHVLFFAAIAFFLACAAPPTEVLKTH